MLCGVLSEFALVKCSGDKRNAGGVEVTYNINRFINQTKNIQMCLISGAGFIRACSLVGRLVCSAGVCKSSENLTFVEQARSMQRTVLSARDAFARVERGVHRFERTLRWNSHR